EVGKDLPALGDEAEAGLGDAELRPAVNRPAPESDLAAAGRRQSHDGADGGGLPHPVAAEECDHLAGVHAEAHAEEHLALAVAGLDAVKLEHAGPHRLPDRPRARARSPRSPPAARWR